MKLQITRSAAAVATAIPLVLAAASGSAESFRMIITELEPPLVPNSVQSLAVELGYY